MKFNQHARVAAASLGALAALFLWGGAASAGHEDRPGHECREARRICHHAERVAMRACAHICESGSGGASCRDECRAVFHVARSRCQEEVRECFASQRPPLDEACAHGCREGFAVCRDELHECRSGCTAAVGDAIHDCVEALGGDPDPRAVRACVREARMGVYLCEDSCYTELSCGIEFRDCLSGCVIDE